MIRVGWVATLKMTSACWRYQVNICRDNKGGLSLHDQTCVAGRILAVNLTCWGKKRDSLREPGWMRFRGMQGATRRE